MKFEIVKNNGKFEYRENGNVKAKSEISVKVIFTYVDGIYYPKLSDGFLYDSIVLEERLTLSNRGLQKNHDGELGINSVNFHLTKNHIVTLDKALGDAFVTVNKVNISLFDFSVVNMNRYHAVTHNDVKDIAKINRQTGKITIDHDLIKKAEKKYEILLKQWLEDTRKTLEQKKFKVVVKL